MEDRKEVSAATRKKISDRMRAKWATPAFREAIVAKATGRMSQPHTDDAKKKISDTLKRKVSSRFPAWPSCAHRHSWCLCVCRQWANDPEYREAVMKNNMAANVTTRAKISDTLRRKWQGQCCEVSAS
jgi:hypothetical protein